VTPAAATLKRWRAEPPRFVREAFGVEPDEWQDDVLRDVADLDRVGAIRLAMVASKGPGKSTVDAWLAWWFLCTRPHGKLVATSITEDNLSDGLWAELAKWQARSPFLQAAFTWTASQVYANEAPATWFASARAWPKGGSAEQQADTLAGIHADHVMFVIDEAGGVPSGVAAAADAGLANATPGSGRTALFLLSGNPTHLEGPLYEAATSDAARWRVHRVNGDPDNPKRSPRVDIEWARGLIKRWGRNHPFVLVNVLGQFPPTQADKLLGPADVDAAESRLVRPHEVAAQAKVLGVDVARFGDDASVLTLRQGRLVWNPRELRNVNTVQLAGQAYTVAQKHRVQAVFVDVGGVGAGVYDTLLSMGAPAVAVDFGSAAQEPDRFANARAEMWWRMAEWVREGGGRLPVVPELRRDLCGPRYSFTRDARVLLESKEDMKKRGLPSTDYGDSLATTFYRPVAPPAADDVWATQVPEREHEGLDWDPIRRR
jgi:hypothetical protein